MKRIIVLPEELELLHTELQNLKALLQIDQRNISDPILNTEGVMNLLKVSRRCLQKWRDERIITFSQVQGKFYYRMSDITLMLDRYLIKVM